jgi:hypothetical protein
MEKVRSPIAEASFKYSGERVPLPISCGLTEFYAVDNPDQVYQRADQRFTKLKFWQKPMY